MKRYCIGMLGALLVTAGLMAGPAPARADEQDSLLRQVTAITTVASTVPANGDLNPYGVAVVPRTIGSLVRGDVLVSNFNNSANLQGTGTTIVQVAPDGTRTLFAQINPAALPGACPGGVGLTTALVVLRSGWVVVGSLPTGDGTATTAQAGCLLVLNSRGAVVETIAGDPINGPWDMTALDHGNRATLFVTNVLNGTVAAGGAVVTGGTVVRLTLAISQGQMPRVAESTVIGMGFPERTDPAALVVGPTGVGLGDDGTLYVADSVGNRIAAIPDALFRETSAGPGQTVSVNGALNDPLGLAIAPNGDILTVNGNDGNAVETTPTGRQIATAVLDATGSLPGSGTLFGLAVAPGDNDERGPGGDAPSQGNSGHAGRPNSGLYFVDDGTNTLNLLHGDAEHGEASR